MKEHMTSWLEISSSALVNNYKELTKSFSPKTKVLAVVKGNAYGHGLSEVILSLKKVRPDFYGVFDPNDVLEIRSHDKRTSILIMIPCNTDMVNFALQNNASISIDSNETLFNITQLKLSQPIKIHLCVETGLGRDGIPYQELSKTLAIIHNKKNILVEGIYTHFSGAESKRFDKLTRTQIVHLIEWESAFHSLGLFPIIHASGTAGSMIGKMFQLDMCRLGIGLYGLWPSEESEAQNKAIKLKPPLSWKTKIVSVKNLPKNHGVGYEESFITSRATKIAVIPVGYYDGIPRSTSNKGVVLINGKKVFLRGKVMMNMCVLDVTGQNVKVGDEVLIIGESKKNKITAEDWANLSTTINYEIVTRINPRLVRKLIK